MDEFDQNRVNQQAFFETYSSETDCQCPPSTRYGYARDVSLRSFIGTSNHKDLLTDTSGSRRYIVVDDRPIDCSPIDYEQLYAQAMHDL